ncbi:MAG: aldehyde dehydrogenase family protein [Pirellulales bacterium]
MSVMPQKSFLITGERFIDGGWTASSGAAWSSRGPLEQQELWSGNWSTPAEVADAVGSAKKAFAKWRSESLERRTEICRAFAETVRERKDELALLIALETGKPLWEALSETVTVIGKVSAAIDALHARRWTTEEDAGGMRAVTRFHPHGVMVVLGPFNLPAHLPGAHIVPALLAGNTIVFKPSEWTPAVGEWLIRAWQAAGLPPGVLNLIHGQAEAARAAVADERIDGVFVYRQLPRRGQYSQTTCRSPRNRLGTRDGR